MRPFSPALLDIASGSAVAGSDYAGTSLAGSDIWGASISGSDVSSVNSTAQGFGSLLTFDISTVSPVAWIAVLLLAVYLAGAISLWRKGKRWSVWTTISFASGTVLWFASTALGVHAAAGELVSALLFQQITLMVVVPPLILSGAPGRLLLAAVPRQGLGRFVLGIALRGYFSKVTHALLNPVVPVIITAVAFPGLYFSGALDAFFALPGGHSILLAIFLVLGILGGIPLWSRDQVPRQPSYLVRLVGVFAEIQIHALVGLILIMNSEEIMFSSFSQDPETWGITRQLDHSIAGTLIWSYGELPLIIMLIVTLSKWRVDEQRVAKRRAPQEDADLDAYNAYLAEQFGSTAPTSDPISTAAKNSAGAAAPSTMQ